jgi:hypothetical protein
MKGVNKRDEKIDDGKICRREVQSHQPASQPTAQHSSAQNTSVSEVGRRI